MASNDFDTTTLDDDFELGENKKFHHNPNICIDELDQDDSNKKKKPKTNDVNDLNKCFLTNKSLKE